MSNQIELIVSKQAQKQLDDLYTALGKSYDEIIKINQTQITLNGGGSPKSLADFNAKVKEAIKLTESLTEAERKLLTDTNKLETLKQKQINTRIRENAETKSKIDLANKEAREIEKVRLSNERLNSAYLQLSKQQAESARRVQDLIAKGRSGAQSQNEYNRELKEAQSEFQKLNQKVLQADTAVGKFNRNVGNYPKQALSSIGNLLGAFGVVGGLSLFAGITKDIYSTTKELQSLDLALKQVTETDSKFAESQSFLTSISEKYGIEINGLTKQFTQFYVSAKDKISGKEIQGIFESVAKSAGFMGLSVDAQNRAFTALNQMMSKGTVSAEELKGQLGEALPGAFGIMAKSMGVTEKQLGKMMQDGKVLASEVLPKFAKELEKAYGIENKNRVESLSASQTRLTNTWTEFIRTLNDSDSGGITKFLSAIIDGANSAVKSLVRLNESWRSVRDRFKEQSQNETSTYLANIKNEKERQEIAKLTQQDAIKNINDYNKKLLEAQAIYKKYNEISLSNFLPENVAKRNQAKKDIEKYSLALGTQKGRLLASQEALNSETKALSNNTDEVKKGTKAKKEHRDKIEAQNLTSKGWIETLEDEIKKYKEVQKSVSDSSQEYKDFQLIIDTLQQSVDLITDPSKVIKAPLLDTSNMANTAEILDKLKEKQNEYLKGFYDQFGSESGMPTLFKVLNKEIDGFGDNWKVTATAMMEIGQELTNTLMAQSEARYNAEYSRLEQQKNISLKFAGDNADAKAEIERQYEDRRKAIQRRQAEAEKRQAMFSIAINTAQAIMATLGKTGFAGIPLSVIVGAVGAVQLAMVASQEIPAFAQGGEHNGGLMLINDAKGSDFEETIVTPDGKAKKYKGRNVVVDAPKGTQIYTPEQWQKMSVKQSINNGINKDDLDSVFRKYSNSQEVEININENGFKKMISSNGRTREILNSRLTTKSRIV